jgi:hypothetical protein
LQVAIRLKRGGEREKRKGRLSFRAPNGMSTAAKAKYARSLSECGRSRGPEERRWERRPRRALLAKPPRLTTYATNDGMVMDGAPR